MPLSLPVSHTIRSHLPRVSFLLPPSPQPSLSLFPLHLSLPIPFPRSMPNGPTLAFPTPPFPKYNCLAKLPSRLLSFVSFPSFLFPMLGGPEVPSSIPPPPPTPIIPFLYYSSPSSPLLSPILGSVRSSLLQGNHLFHPYLLLGSQANPYSSPS